jgi:type IV secretory pathway VirB2 component (pilin)
LGQSQKIASALTLILIVAFPMFGFCSVESSLAAVQSKLIGTILPLVAIIGLVFAGLSFVAGSQNARSHLVLAIIGAAIGFGAPSIVSWIQSLIH